MDVHSAAADVAARDETQEGSPRASARGGALIVTAIAAVYFATFVRYGYQLGEDGDVVYLIFRTLAGQRPYVDFASGYTPGFFYSNAALLHLFGADLRVLRWSLVLVNSGAVLCLYLLGARVMPAVLAAAAALAYVALMPVFPGEFATFNIPYPAWHVVLFWALSLLAFLRARERGQRRWIFVAGALAALGCAFKPNTGSFNLAALALLLLADCGPERSPASRLLWVGLLVAVVVALAATFGFRVANRDARLLLWPVFALAAVIAAAAPRRARSAAGGFASQAVLLLLGFAAITLPWAAYYLAALGVSRFMHDVLFIGSGHELFFYMPIRDLDAWDAAMAVTAVGFFAASFGPARWLAQRRWLLPLGAAAAALVALAAWSAPMPEGFQRAAVSRFEYLAYGAALLTHWVGVALVARRLRQPVAPRGEARRRAELAIAISAPLLFLSIYPRSDFFHWVLSAPMTLVLAALLYWRVVARWPAGRWALAWAAAPLYAALAILWLPGLSLAARLAVAPRESFAELGLPRAPLVLESGRAARLRYLRQTVEYIEAHSAPDDTLLGFPNLHLVNLLSGRQVPGRYGSFNPGWPDHVVEAEIVDALHQRRTPLVVINQSQQLYIGNAPVYYFLLEDYLRRNYRLAASFGDYRILARRAAGDADNETPIDTPPAAGDDAAAADCRGAIRTVQATRSQSARLLAPCWNAGALELQEEAVAAARAAQDPEGAATLAGVLRHGTLRPRAALIAVRAIGESADARSVPAVLDALDHVDGRVRDELVTALLDIAVRSFFDDNQLFPRPLGLEEIRADDRAGILAALWLTAEDPRLRYIGAWIAGVRRERSTAPDLQRLLAQPPLEFQAVAAASLLQMGVSDGVAEPLLEGMARDEMYLPTALLAWSRANPVRARELLADRFRRGNPLQRESIAFVAAALGDPALAEVLRGGISDPDPLVRAASVWAAGVLGDEAARAQVEKALDADPVEQVRGFAKVALQRIDESGSRRQVEVVGEPG